jgi:hypothetical protein
MDYFVLEVASSENVMVCEVRVQEVLDAPNAVLVVGASPGWKLFWECADVWPCTGAGDRGDGGACFSERMEFTGG